MGRQFRTIPLRLLAGIRSIFAAVPLPLGVCAALMFALPFIAGEWGAFARPAPLAPSVDHILDHYAQALGGRAALEKTRSMVISGVMNVSGAKGPVKTTEYFQYPDHFAAVAEIPGLGTARTIYDGKTAWNADPKKGVTALSGPQLSDIRRRADIHWDLKLKEFYSGLKLVGHEKVSGKDAWVLEDTLDGWTYRFYFDSSSGLLVRFDTDTHKPGRASSVLISDYRQVGQVRFAFGASMTSSKLSWSRRLNEVRFNIPIDDAVFAKPSGQTGSGSASGGRPQRQHRA